MTLLLLLYWIGSLLWIAGAEFPIQMDNHVTTLGYWTPSTSTSHQVLVLPPEVTN